MRYHEYITEALSKIVYHYTRLSSALKIVRSGRFELTSSVGTSWEEQFAPKGYYYYLSTTRTRHGGYHDFVGSDAVLIQLDGDFYNSRYPSSSVDYWGNRNPIVSHHRQHEAEDRLFSKTNSIPAKITKVDIYLSHDADSSQRARARKLVLACKQSNIRVRLFDDLKAWKQGQSSKTVGLEVLQGQEDARGYTSRHRGYLLPWLELIYKKNQQDLSNRADSIRYDLNYTYDFENLARSLAVDFSNARKPNSGPDRDNVIKIINFMIAHKLSSIKELMEFLKNKWAAKK